MQQKQPETLRLMAQDEADIEVVSALLQDAIIAGSDMHFDAQNACFLIVANRFCWERPALAEVNASSGGAVRERALCGLRISHVVDVQKRCWPLDWRTAFFNILALKPVAVSQQDKGCVMEFSFSGGPSLRLISQKIDLALGDLDDGRPTNLQPRHDI
jgi:hypothetical protein